MNNNETESKTLFLINLENEDGNMYNALKLTGLSIYKVKKWAKEDPEFEYRLNELAELEARWVESKLKEKIKEGNPSSIQFYLRTKGKSLGYTETTKQEVDLNGNVDIEAALEKMAAQVSGAE